MKHVVTSVVEWMKTRWLFWLIILLPLFAAAANNIANNGLFLYEHIAQPDRISALAAVLIIGTTICWCVCHFFKLKACPEGKKLWQIYVLAAGLSLCGNLTLYLPDGFYPVAFLSAMGTLCLLWAIFRHYALLFWIPFMFIEMLQIGAHVQYGAIINNPVILAEIFEATNDEFLGYINIFNIIIALILVAICFAFAFIHNKIFKGLNRLTLLNTGAFSVTLAAGFIHLFHPNKISIDNLWPSFEVAKFHLHIREAFSGNGKLLNYVNSLPSPALQPSSISTVVDDSGVVLVLHIGESVRADRLGINGYRNQGRLTTPWLYQQQRSRSLINFSNCISSNSMTCFAMITLLTDARRDIHHPNPEYAAKCGSVIDLFDANHFSVASFCGKLSGRMVKAEQITQKLIEKAKESYWADGMPITIIPTIKKVVQAHPDENLVLYINNEGSHMPFRYYDVDKAPFLPARPSLSNPSAHAQEVNNAYDNTIHYTDEFIHQVAELLKERPFIYVYVSDHGEYLGYDGLWGRGGVKDYHQTTACRVGMFIITSPEFEALHPHFANAVKNLRENADMTVGHEHIFHTLLGIFGISTPYYDAKLDLSSENPEPYTGPQPKTKPQPDALPASLSSAS